MAEKAGSGKYADAKEPQKVMAETKEKEKKTKVIAHADKDQVVRFCSGFGITTDGQIKIKLTTSGTHWQLTLENVIVHDVDHVVRFLRNHLSKKNVWTMCSAWHQAKRKIKSYELIPRFSGTGRVWLSLSDKDEHRVDLADVLIRQQWAQRNEPCVTRRRAATV